MIAPGAIGMLICGPGQGGVQVEKRPETHKQFDSSPHQPAPRVPTCTRLFNQTKDTLSNYWFSSLQPKTTTKTAHTILTVHLLLQPNLKHICTFYLQAVVGTRVLALTNLILLGLQKYHVYSSLGMGRNFSTGRTCWF